MNLPTSLFASDSQIKNDKQETESTAMAGTMQRGKDLLNRAGAPIKEGLKDAMSRLRRAATSREPTCKIRSENNMESGSMLFGKRNLFGIKEKSQAESEEAEMETSDSFYMHDEASLSFRTAANTVSNSTSSTEDQLHFDASSIHSSLGGFHLSSSIESTRDMQQTMANIYEYEDPDEMPHRYRRTAANHSSLQMMEDELEDELSDQNVRIFKNLLNLSGENEGYDDGDDGAFSFDLGGRQKALQW